MKKKKRRKAKPLGPPMAGKPVNLDFWLSRDYDGTHILWVHEPQYDTATDSHHAAGDFIVLNSDHRIFSGLKPTDYCRVRLQRMD